MYTQLDSLWTSYLNLLQQYTTAQAILKSHLSSGFLSLAESNFHTSGGQRFGKDYYDERMVARTRLRVSKEEAGGGKARVVRIARVGEGQSAEEGEGKRQEKAEDECLLSRTPASDSNSQDKGAASSDDENDSHDQVDPEKKLPIDTREPIRWFGILVPSSLRQAQKSFSSAVLDGDALTKAINSARGMREIEAEIRKLRKAIKKAEKEEVSALGEGMRRVEVK